MRTLRENLRATGWVGLVLATVFTLSGCGGGSSGTQAPPPSSGPPPTQPPTTAAPTAAFTAADNAPLNTPVIFDASASTSGSGELQYFWDFGSGQHGGGKVIARMFATSGASNVTLTVMDAGGRSATQARTITIASPATPPAVVAAQGSVTTVDEVALQGVSVTPFGTTTSASTDAMGKVNVSIAAGTPLAVKLSKDGYADQFVSLTMPESAGSDAYFTAVMRPRDAALTLADAAAGGSLNGRDGATITLPANALVNSSGVAVTGPVQIAMTPVDITEPGAGGFPGSFDGITPSGTTTPIVSFGTTEYVLSANGGPLQLAPGKTAVIEVPLYATEKIDGTMLMAGDTTPLWSLDEATGIWVQEGEGTVVASASSPTGLAMRATVSHFTWWNSDLGFDPFGPKPRCVYDDDIGIPEARDHFATATICNMLAEIDRGLGGVGSSKMAINAESPRFVGYSRRAAVPIAGDTTIPVPANVDISLSAAALNGTWTGRRVVNGPVGEQREIVIAMRPLQSTGPEPDLVTVPFDGTRSLETNQTAWFNFNGVALRYARITVTPVQGSTLSGSVRFLQGQSVLATANYGGFNSQPIIAMLPAATRYTVEVTGVSGTPGGYRLQIELLGTSSSEAVTIPYRVDVGSLPQLTVLQKSFTVATPYTAHIAFQQEGNALARAALTGPGGVVYNFAPLLGSERTDAAVVNLTPGNYALSVGSDRGTATTFSAKIEQTAWENIGPPLEGIMNTYNVIGVVADTNGRPVVGYTREFVVSGGRVSSAVVLKRWTGSAWQDVGSELVIDYPCNGAEAIDFTLDSTNAPVVIYGSSSFIQGVQLSYVTVRRFSGGTWQGIGPNDGVLPQTDTFSGSCATPPLVRLAANDRPVVVYQGGNTQYVQRFDGTNWVDVAAGSTFASSNSTIELGIDGNDRLWMVLANPTYPFGRVTRLNPTPTPAWEAIGPNNGVLPSTANVGSIYNARLRFDASGNPVLGASAAIGSGGTYSNGLIVYRYNGTIWSTSGGYQSSGPNSRSATPRTHSFALWNGEAVTGWINNFSNSGIADTVLQVQSNSPSGWTPIGPGDGRVPQFTPDPVPSIASAITQKQATQVRMVTIGSDLYMAVCVVSTDINTTIPRRVYLLRKSAN